MAGVRSLGSTLPKFSIQFPCTEKPHHISKVHMFVHGLHMMESAMKPEVESIVGNVGLRLNMGNCSLKNLLLIFYDYNAIC